MLALIKKQAKKEKLMKLLGKEKDEDNDKSEQDIAFLLTKSLPYTTIRKH